MPFPLTFLARRTFAGPTCRTTSLLTLIPYIMQSKGLNSQVLKRFYKPLITLPKERLPTVHCYVLHQVLAVSLTNLALFNFSLIFIHRSCLQRPRCLRLRWQRLWRNLLHAASLQPQYAMATSRERQVM